MIDEKEILAFVHPYYVTKDIMHDMWHIELVKKMIDKILSISHYEVDKESLLLATYFHGFIYSDEDKIKQWLATNEFKKD